MKADPVNVHSATEEETTPCLFKQALGADYFALPEPVRDLHEVSSSRTFRGTADVTRGNSGLGNLVCALVGFPPEANDVPVTVAIERRGDKEHWQRTFGKKTFASVLSLRGANGGGHICERFGALEFDIDLEFENARLHYPVKRARGFGVPLPRWLVPVSQASEFEENGRFNFDVKVSLPGIGMLVRYRGVLTPDDKEV
ncbi:DUF4166 domain-containing protein [Roseibium sp. MMSF_3544]|uniref:DUF4166 domain-containing protein n=1 Tax=unclassified Roseibium TaxID=2629323 RepID=UPI00273F3CAE|nr:DUF4166 domain-containing protein [Roseibium sp. MMSF_3544]